ncbi:MAG: hypothetical protein QXX17_04260 [Conexivisphaerales archaeon]
MLASSTGKVLWLFFSTLFALASMVLGGMLAIVPSDATKVYIVYPGIPVWDYPMLWIDFHRIVFAFPFLPTIFMILISAGVGLGSAVTAMLLMASRKNVNLQVSAVGSVPVITGLSTVGACCCTTCLSTAGVAVVASVSSVPTWQILLNDWYLGLFQLVIVFFSLIVLERELMVNQGICDVQYSRKKVALSTILRISLLIAGITWSLAMLVEWGDTSPVTASPATWYHWLFEHQLLSLFAIGAAFSPSKVYSFLKHGGLQVRMLKAGLVIAAITWGLWVPQPLVSAGLGGFLNELFGYLNLPASLGAAAPDSALGAALLFHWLFQHELLSMFALLASLSTDSIFAGLLWSTRQQIVVKETIKRLAR